MAKKLGISRRNFLKSTAITAGAAVAIGSGIKSVEACTLPEKWDRTVDVVVIGAGGAGMMAAIQAHDAGAEVLVIDKGTSVFNSATRMAGGVFSAAGTKIQKEEGIKDSPEDHARDVMAYGDYMNYPDIVKVWTENCGVVFDWMCDHGLAEFRLSKDWVGHNNVRAAWQNSYSGRDYVEVSYKVLQEKKINLEYSTSVARYFYDEESARVVGIEAAVGRDKFTVRAKKGVILASGGFTSNSKLLDSWVPSVAGVVIVSGCGTNDGSAMMMAVRDLGIPLTHMQYIAAYPWGMPTGGRYGNTCRFFFFMDEGGILVNKKGDRFVNEELGVTKITNELPKQEGKIHFLLVDHTMWTETLKKYDLGKALFTHPAWTKEKLDEELKKGQVLFTADTLENVSKLAGVPPEELAKTVEKYNKAVEDKNDAEFGRQKFSRGIKDGPFYMVKMTFWSPISLGGIRVNTDMQVKDSDGNGIKGLYGAGEVVGGVHGTSYLGGNSISWSHTSGYLAGKNVVKQG